LGLQVSRSSLFSALPPFGLFPLACDAAELQRSLFFFVFVSLCPWLIVPRVRPIAFLPPVPPRFQDVPPFFLDAVLSSPENDLFPQHLVLTSIIILPFLVLITLWNLRRVLFCLGSRFLWPPCPPKFPGLACSSFHLTSCGTMARHEGGCGESRSLNLEKNLGRVGV